MLRMHVQAYQEQKRLFRSNTFVKRAGVSIARMPWAKKLIFTDRLLLQSGFSTAHNPNHEYHDFCERLFKQPVVPIPGKLPYFTSRGDRLLLSNFLPALPLAVRQGGGFIDSIEVRMKGSARLCNQDLFFHESMVTGFEDAMQSLRSFHLRAHTPNVNQSLVPFINARGLKELTIDILLVKNRQSLIQPIWLQQFPELTRMCLRSVKISGEDFETFLSTGTPALKHVELGGVNIMRRSSWVQVLDLLRGKSLDCIDITSPILPGSWRSAYLAFKVTRPEYQHNTPAEWYILGKKDQNPLLEHGEAPPP
jgi:hypothetical protein